MNAFDSTTPTDTAIDSSMAAPETPHRDARDFEHTRLHEAVGRANANPRYGSIYD
jgi:hypothetical protein